MIEKHLETTHVGTETTDQPGAFNLEADTRHTTQGEHLILDSFQELPGFWGYVERLDDSGGLTGWAAGESPHNPPVLVLEINGQAVAKTQPNQTRPDIWQDNQLEYLAGFSFSLDTLLPLALRTDLSPAEPISVIIEGTPFELPLHRPWTLGDVVAAVEASRQQRRAEEALQSLPLHHALNLQLRRAVRLMLLPRRADPALRDGLIESVSFLPGQHLLISGWWGRQHSDVCAAVLISAGRKLPAALGLLRFDRPDLGADQCGFIGLVKLDEHPALVDGQPQFSVSLGDVQHRWIETARPLRVLSPEAALGELSDCVGARPSLRARELLHLVRDLLPWSPQADAAQRLGLRAGIDRFAVIPGFGVLVSGWALSPVGVLEDVAARLGDSLCLAEPGSLSLHARPDLAPGLPSLRDQTAWAGFHGVLRSQVPPDTQDTWWLRLRFSDGSALWLDVPMDAARVVRPDVTLETLAQFDSAIAHAPWLPDLVEPLWGWRPAPQRLNHPGVAEVTLAPQVLVQALPDDAQLLRLALDRLSLLLPELSQAGVLLQLLLPASLNRGELQTWLALGLSQHPRLKLQLHALPVGVNAWQVLPAVLEPAHRQQSSERFVFIGPQVLPSVSGLRLLLAQLQAPDLASHPRFAASQGLDAADQPVLHHDAQLFAWTVADFLQRAPLLPAWVGGWHRRNGLALDAAGDVPEVAGWRLPPRPGPLTVQVNEQRLLAWASRPQGTPELATETQP